jgi:hypothetical protein
VPVVALTRLGLSLFSYRTIRRWFELQGESLPATRSIGRLGWAVRSAARLVPGASCLTQALAAQFLLSRWGRPSHIRIGVAKDPSGKLLAHAWLISDSKVVVGGSASELGRYAVLTDLGAKVP